MVATKAYAAIRPIMFGLACVLMLGVGLKITIGLAANGTSPVQQTATPIKIGPSGLPIPRFVSLKADRVNVRRGPSKNYAIEWVYARQGLPVEIITESDNWRQVRDSDGDEGWVFHSLLSGRRTALVAPWMKETTLPMHEAPKSTANVSAEVEPGVLGRIERCDGSWCLMAIGEVQGWMPQRTLWGAYPGEVIE
ncbi:MAG: SH3 domain-containing protein [Hyphomicrobiales bacterium]|jgi:SH3-like domain-containing protein|nr:SH3 domain-containing protein [Hyphomicrobiales bacterium]